MPALLLLTLLVILGFLQVHWLEQMRVADDQRSRADLEARLQRVADDFNRQLGRLFLEIQPLRRRSFGAIESSDDLPGFLAELLAGWREEAPFPEMVDASFLWNPRARNTTVWRLEPLETVPWQTIPATLADAMEVALQGRESPEDGGPPDKSHGPPELLVSEVPAILIPVAIPPGRFHESRQAPRRNEAREEDKDRGRREAEAPRRRLRDTQSSRRHHYPIKGPIVAILLDRDVIRQEVLPRLVEQAFGPDLGFHLRLVEKASGDSLLELGPAAPSSATVDASVELFGPLSVERRRGRGRSRFLDRSEFEQGQWILEASHPTGSLAGAIAAAHRRNLAISLGILAILAASLIVLSRGAARSRRLARQQLDFVAGITHELMTPLAALRSAGQNLADGVVRETPQVERYGRMIDREGQRLSTLVEQVLAFSRMQSGPPDLRPERLDAGAEARAVLEEMQGTFDAAALTGKVALQIDGEPWVMADSQALRRALSNLISNAVKYGQDPQDPWLGIQIRRAGGQILFEIADHGPGIAAGDRPHLFKPFYRGSGLAASRIPGSGLGLALVHHLIEGQGGSVEFRPHRDAGDTPGARFTLRLPAATDRAEEKI